MANPQDIIVALCDGHGGYVDGKPTTSGKRTPKFPDGSVMLENEFNEAVVNYLDKELTRLGFKTLLVAPTDADTPLETRVKLANNTIKNKYNKPASIYISVHANALAGKWGTHGGTETYHFTGSVNGKKLATSIHKFLMKGEPLRDRKVKEAGFYVLKYTSMPAALAECGFMDNLLEAKLLKSNAFRKECAIEIAQGICEYFGITYVPEPKPVAPKVVDKEEDVFRIKVGDEQIVALTGYTKCVEYASEKLVGKTVILESVSSGKIYNLGIIPPTKITETNYKKMYEDEKAKVEVLQKLVDVQKNEATRLQGLYDVEKDKVVSLETKIKNIFDMLRKITID